MKKIKTICIAGRIYCGVWNQTCLFELETSFVPALGEQLKEIDNFLANIANALIVAMKQATIIRDFNVEIDVDGFGEGPLNYSFQNPTTMSIDKSKWDAAINVKAEEVCFLEIRPAIIETVMAITG